MLLQMVTVLLFDPPLPPPPQAVRPSEAASAATPSSVVLFLTGNRILGVLLMSCAARRPELVGSVTPTWDCRFGADVIDLTAESNQQDHCGEVPDVSSNDSETQLTRDDNTGGCGRAGPVALRPARGGQGGGRDERRQADPHRRRDAGRRLRRPPRRTSSTGAPCEMRISTDTEQRVRRAAVELDYRPNRSARSLRTAHHRDDRRDLRLRRRAATFASRMLTGANAAARGLDHLAGDRRDRGRPATWRSAHRGDARPPGRRHRLRHPGRPRDRPSRPAWRASRVVLLNCMDPRADLPSVLPDDVLGGRVAAEALLDAGLRRATSTSSARTRLRRRGRRGRLRLAGVHDGWREAGLDLAGVVPCDVGRRRRRTTRCRRGWLGRATGPRGLICLNDRIAMGIYQALAERGLRRPRRRRAWSPSTAPSWPPGCGRASTSVALPFAAMGRRRGRDPARPRAYDGSAPTSGCR